MHVIELLDGQKLQQGLHDLKTPKELLYEAEQMAEEAGIQAKAIVRVSHRISQGIIDTATEEHCNFILTGRQKRPAFLSRIFYSTIDAVLRKSPSEIAVLHGTFKSGNVKNILLPFGGDIHTQLAVEIAPALLEFFKAKLRIVIIFTPLIKDSVRQGKISQINGLIRDNKIPATVDIITDEDILRGILKEARGADLLLMSGRSGDFLELLFARSLVREITEDMKCPVLWVKEYEERDSFFLSLFRPYKR